MAAQATREIKLTPDQTVHVNRMFSTLERHFVAYDSSSMGLGKTICTLALAKAFKMRLIVLGTSKLKDVWQLEYNKYRDYLEDVWFAFYSLESLTVGNNNVMHMEIPMKIESRKGKFIFVETPFDAITKVKKGKEITNVKFHRIFKEIVLTKSEREDGPQGTFIVIDEAHKIKDESPTNTIISYISRLIIDECQDSRILFLSGTPLSDPVHSRNICRALGFIRETKLYEKQGGQVVPLALAEVIDQARHVIRETQDQDEKVTLATSFRKIMKEYECNPKDNYSDFKWANSGLLVHELFTEVILEGLSSAIPPNFETTMIYRGFFNITDEASKTLITDGISQLNEFVPEIGKFKARGGPQPRPKKGEKKKPAQHQFKASVGLSMVQEGLVSDVCRFAVDILKRDTGDRIIISCDYIIPMRKAAKYFQNKGYNVSILAGTDVTRKVEQKISESKKVKGVMVPKSKKEIYSDKFVKMTQDDQKLHTKKWKEGKTRVLIMNTGVGGIGQNLQDRTPDGSAKRWLFVFPSFSIIELQQVAFRIFRTDMTSIGECYYVYPLFENQNSVADLDDIVTRHILRSRYSASALKKRDRGLSKFPGDHQRFIEPREYVLPRKNKEGKRVNLRVKLGGFINEDMVPRREFKSKRTGKHFELEMPVSQLITNLKANPRLQEEYFTEQVIKEVDWEHLKRIRYEDEVREKADSENDVGEDEHVSDELGSFDLDELLNEISIQSNEEDPLSHQAASSLDELINEESDEESEEDEPDDKSENSEEELLTE